MPDLRSQLIEAIEAALFVDGWEMGMAMDPTGVAATALDAVLDELTEQDEPWMYAARALHRGPYPSTSDIPNMTAVHRLIAVLRPVVEEPK